MTPSTRNILKVYRSATPEQLSEGLEWYPRARSLAVELVQQYRCQSSVEISRAAAVIAVVSPRLRWDKNEQVARMAYAQWDAVQSSPHLGIVALTPLPILGANSAKAFRLLAGEAPDDVVSGPKVRAFWLTITDPTDPRTVVVDRHALDVAVGRVLDDASRGAILGRKGAYDSVCELYRRAARIASREAGRTITPAQLQAVTWLAWRASKRKAVK